jgi:hypothetical protein
VPLKNNNLERPSQFPGSAQQMNREKRSGRAAANDGNG